MGLSLRGVELLWGDMAFKDSIQAATGAAMATPRRRVAVRVAGGVVAALAVFGLAGYFGGPPLIKYLVEKNATEALGAR
jgi:Na+/glutamate symporter